MRQLLAFAACATLCMSVAAMAQQKGDAETDLWNAIDPRQPCEYKAYLEDYPKGKYASLARLRLAACPTASGPIPPGPTGASPIASSPTGASPTASSPTAPGPAAPSPPVPSPAASSPTASSPAASSPTGSPGTTSAPAGAAGNSAAVPANPTAARLEDMLRQRRIFNCSPDSQSFTVRAGVLSYSGCGLDGTRVKGSAILSSLAVRGAYVKPLDDALIQREPALKDYVALWVPCARGSCYNIAVTSAGGDRTFAQELAAMAFYVPRSSSEEFLGLVKALAASAGPG